jgi:hypothetical protein
VDGELLGIYAITDIVGLAADLLLLIEGLIVAVDV